MALKRPDTPLAASPEPRFNDTIKKTPVDKQVDRLVSQSADRNKRMAQSKATEKKAVSDSTAVDNKLRSVGYTKQAGEMGNKKANETRKSGSAYKGGSFQKVLDKKTGKYEKKFILNK
jgi:hypothetical protein